MNLATGSVTAGEDHQHGGHHDQLGQGEARLAISAAGGGRDAQTSRCRLNLASAPERLPTPRLPAAGTAGAGDPDARRRRR